MATIGWQVGNETDIVGWQPNPLTRGTADILTGCLITLSLCIWSALHINVAGKDGWYARVWAKIFWALLCLVAPEVVAAIAWNQRKQAVRLAAHMNKELGLAPPLGFWTRFWARICSLPNLGKEIFFWRKNPDKKELEIDEEAGNPAADLNPAERKHPWTIKHAFFARMGGFGLYIPPLPDHLRFLPKDNPEDTYLITPTGMELLAQYPDAHKDIPDISKDEINAMSRASAFAKFIVCGQAIWFICQVLIRLIQHLPISLLELNTVAHAICVLLTFVYWWDKPFDVERPYYMQSRFLHPSAAAKQMENHTTDLAELWFSKAREYLADQESRFELLSNWVYLPLRPLPCKDLASYVRSPSEMKKVCSNLYNFITFSRPAVVDDALFVRFCTEEQRQDAEPIPETTSVSWAKEIEGTQFFLAATMPGKYFKTLSPLQYPGYPYHNWLKVFLATSVQHANDTMVLIAALFYSPMILLALVMMLIIPQARMNELSTWTQSGQTEDIFASKWLTRKARDGFPPDQPRTIREFLELSDPGVQLKTSDVILLQTAWHCVQIRYRPDCLRRLRQSEWSSADLKWHFRSDAGFFISFALFTAVYGGLHFIGLRAPFPSSTLQTIWEISSILVTSGILTAGMIVYPALWTWRKFHSKVGPKIKSYLSTRPVRRRFFEEVSRLTSMLLLMICSAALLAYFLARFALVVECFISLSHQPRDVYTVRPWAAYWPHIS